VIEIGDTGCGIPPAVLKRVFEPFFTTKAIGEGTGLGLSICHGIISAFGGEIAVESTVGVGTTVRISVPPTTDQAAVPVAPATPAPKTTTRPRLLVVDDDDRLRETVGRMLQKDHDVTLASQATQALELIEHGARFDVIVSDVMMPEMTGIDLYTELQRIDPRQASRVVFITGGAFTQSARDFLDAVSNPRLEKPFDPKELREIVRGVALSEVGQLLLEEPSLGLGARKLECAPIRGSGAAHVA
jgi:CheY-like chemotaxis protein